MGRQKKGRMIAYSGFDEIDLQIMALKAVGYRMYEMIEQLGVTQSTISHRMKKIRKWAHCFSIAIIIQPNLFVKDEVSDEV
jgi:transcriptional antiterminator